MRPIRREEDTTGAADDILAALKGVPGFRAAAVLSPSGAVLASLAPGDVDLETIAEEANRTLVQSKEALCEMGAGRGELVYIEGSEARILAQCIDETDDGVGFQPGRAHIHGVLVLRPEGQFGMGKLRLAEAMGTLRELYR